MLEKLRLALRKGLIEDLADEFDEQIKMRDTMGSLMCLSFHKWTFMKMGEHALAIIITTHSQLLYWRLYVHSTARGGPLFYRGGQFANSDTAAPTI